MWSLVPENKFSALQTTPKLSPEKVVIPGLEEQWAPVFCFSGGIWSFPETEWHQLSKHDGITWHNRLCQGHESWSSPHWVSYDCSEWLGRTLLFPSPSQTKNGHTFFAISHWEAHTNVLSLAWMWAALVPWLINRMPQKWASVTSKAW